MASYVALHRHLRTGVSAEWLRVHAQPSAAAATWMVAKTAVPMTATLALCAYLPAWYIWLPAVVFMAAFQHALIIIGHTAQHRRLYRQRWLNDGVGALCHGFIYGFGLVNFQYGAWEHREHHKHNWDPMDPYRGAYGGPYGARPRPRRALLCDLGRFALGAAPRVLAGPLFAIGLGPYFRYGHHIGRGATLYPEPVEPPSLGADAEVRAGYWTSAVLNTALLAVVGLTGAWLFFAVLWLAPLLVLQPLAGFRLKCEHTGITDPDDQSRATRTIIECPRLYRWALFPHGIEYHLEHHAFPAVQPYHLPELHRKLAARGLFDGLDVMPLRSAIAQMLADRGPEATRRE